MKKLGFVQADPIRAPARAQDLILRLRVKDYRAGDLEAKYRELRLEEDYLYAYGFVTRATSRLLHPRPQIALTPAEQRVLAIVTEHKRIHPRVLETYLGRERELNAWGGYSKVTTRILERLHYRGWLRVAGRERGNRLYAPTVAAEQAIIAPLEDTERLHALVLRIAAILGPISERSLRATLRHLAYAAPGLDGRKTAVTQLLQSGQLKQADVDGVRYVWPEAMPVRRSVPEAVRFLAPFDPLVWDRVRFEHLWGWQYRFEAYTPAEKRKLGYYALPLLWRDAVVGWVNASVVNGKLRVKPGFVASKPAEPSFRSAFEQELERFRVFLRL